MRVSTLVIAAAICVTGTPLGAQTVEPTRAEAAAQERLAKAARLEPYRPGKVERFLRRLEDGGFGRLFAPSDGFGVRVSGIEGGSGFALGPSWRTSGLAGGNLVLSASGVRSISGDTGADVSMAIPHLGSHRLSMTVGTSVARLNRARYFGLGLDTLRPEETAYGLARDRAVASVTFAATRHLQLIAAAGTLRTESTAGRSTRVPTIEQRFTAADAPGLRQRIAYSTVSAGVAYDYRDVPGNSRSGGRYAVDVTRYSAGTQPHSFTRVDSELEQHLSFWRRQRLITVRAIASATVADAGHEVPFYLQPTLGGSRVLRGFVSDRFRDRNVVAVQAEYAWDLLPFVSAVAFVEAGTTAARWRDLDTRQLKKDYGLGFRFGSARTVAFRTDVALGSGEGTRLTMRFNHAF